MGVRFLGSGFVRVVPREVRLLLGGAWVRWCLGVGLRFGSAFVQEVPRMYQESLIFTQFPCGGPNFLSSESWQRTSQRAQNQD